MDHCCGCGRPPGTCPTGGACRSAFEPPRFCVSCGRRLRVLVTPTGWKAECRDHGPIGQGGAPGTGQLRRS